jgi:hypothetical protein
MKMAKIEAITYFYTLSGTILLLFIYLRKEIWDESNIGFWFLNHFVNAGFLAIYFTSVSLILNFLCYVLIPFFGFIFTSISLAAAMIFITNKIMDYLED